MLEVYCDHWSGTSFYPNEMTYFQQRRSNQREVSISSAFLLWNTNTQLGFLEVNKVKRSN